MFIVLTNTRNSKLYIIIALATALLVILTFAVVPSIVVSEPGLIPVTGSEAAYAQYLKGEKALYTNAVELDSTLWAYRLGEKNLDTHSYRPPLDECFDVSLSELAECREASQSTP